MAASENPSFNETEILGFDDYEVSLGDKMRGERATLGKTIEDVEAELRIQAQYIEAIENSSTEAFGSTSLIAGFVKSYADYLGMDPNAAYTKFCEESGFVGSVVANTTGTRVETNAKAAKKLKRRNAKGTMADKRFDAPSVPLLSNAERIGGGVSLAGIFSVCLIFVMIGGLGYGGYTVLQELQRVDFAPVENEPEVAARVTTLDPSLIVPERAPDFDAIPRAQSLDELYRPKELAYPTLVSRDGPIAAIDPEKIGGFAPSLDVLPDLPQDIVIPALPVVTLEAEPEVDIVAINPAWVRVFKPEGDILFEKILAKGERYRVPRDAEDALLRAGNSGSVFLMVNEKAFGPIGSGTSVARKIALEADTIRATHEAAELPENLAVLEPLNIDDLAASTQIEAE